MAGLFKAQVCLLALALAGCSPKQAPGTGQALPQESLPQAAPAAAPPAAAGPGAGP